MVASVSKTPFTSFFPISFSAAIFSISCDFVIWAAILCPSRRFGATDNNIWKNLRNLHQRGSAQLLFSHGPAPTSALCPLCPQHQTFAVDFGRSVSCQERPASPRPRLATSSRSVHLLADRKSVV